jgi:hypothetical protein
MDDQKQAHGRGRRVAGTIVAVAVAIAILQNDFGITVLTHTSEAILIIGVVAGLVMWPRPKRNADELRRTEPEAAPALGGPRDDASSRSADQP